MVLVFPHFLPLCNQFIESTSVMDAHQEKTVASTLAASEPCSSEAMHCWWGDKTSQVYLQDATAHVPWESCQQMQSHNCHASTSAHGEIQGNCQEEENKPVPRIAVNTHFIS